MKLVIFLVFLASLGVRALSDDHEVEYFDEINAATHKSAPKPPDAREKALAEQFARAHRECARDDWACQLSCRRQFFTKTGKCRLPHPNDNCFGVPIRYNYTVEEEGFDRFPQEFEILKKFPKCWSSLAPLICATQYRPCSYRSYYSVGMEEPAMIELWQVFRKDFCIRAKTDCRDIAARGFWPQFIDCEDEVLQDGSVTGRRGLFREGNECKMHYRERPSITTQGQCLWPLVNSSSIEHAPVIDRCHLPCETPLVYTAEQWTWRFFSIIFVLLFGLGMVFTALYLFFVSKSYVESFCTFCITNVLLSGTVLSFLWVAGALFPKESMCSDENRLRNVPHGYSFCTVQAFTLIFTLTTMVAWEALFVILFICRKASWRFSMISAFPHLRSSVMIAVTVAGMALAGIAVQHTEIDPGTGICFVGIHDFHYAFLAFHMPMILAVMVVGVIFVVGYIRYKSEGQGMREHRDFVNQIDDLSINRLQWDPIDCPMVSVGWFTFLLVICVTTSCLLHFMWLKPEDHESKAILDSIQCSLNETFSSYDPSWANHISYQSAETDPNRRSRMLGGRVTSSPQCKINAPYFHPVITFLYVVLLPLLPVLTLFYYILQGFFRTNIDITDFRSPRDGPSLFRMFRPVRSPAATISKEAEAEQGLLEVAPSEETKRAPVEFSDSELPAPSVSRPFGSTEQLNYSVRMRDLVESGFETEPVTANGDLNGMRKSYEAQQRFEKHLEAKKQIIDSSSDGEGAMTSVSQRQGNAEPFLPQIQESECETMPIGNLYTEEQVQLTTRMICEKANQLAQENSLLHKAVDAADVEVTRLREQSSEQLSLIAKLKALMGTDGTQSESGGSLDDIREEDEISIEEVVPRVPRDDLLIMAHPDFEVDSTVDGMEAILNPYRLAHFLARHEDILGTPSGLRVLRHYQRTPGTVNDSENLFRSGSGLLYEFSPEYVHFYFPDEHAYFTIFTEDDLKEMLRTSQLQNQVSLDRTQTRGERYRMFFHILHCDGVVYRHDMRNPMAISSGEYARALQQELSTNNIRLTRPYQNQPQVPQWVPRWNKGRKVRSDDHLDNPSCSRFDEPANREPDADEDNPIEEIADQGGRITPGMFEINFDEEDYAHVHPDPRLGGADSPNQGQNPRAGPLGSTPGSVESLTSMEEDDNELGFQEAPQEYPEVIAPEDQAHLMAMVDELLPPEGPQQQRDPNAPGPSREAVRAGRDLFEAIQQHPDTLWGEGTAESRNYHERFRSFQEFLTKWNQVKSQLPKAEDIQNQNPDWEPGRCKAFAHFLENPRKVFDMAMRVQDHSRIVRSFNEGENVQIALDQAGIPRLNAQQIEAEFEAMLNNDLFEVDEPEENQEGFQDWDETDDDDMDEDEEEEYESSDEGVESQNGSFEDIQDPQDPQDPHP